MQKIKMSYLVSGVLFLVIACIGGFFLSWPVESFAFLLVTYLVVIIGIRLDEISGRLVDIQEQLVKLQDRQK